MIAERCPEGCVAEPVRIDRTLYGVCHIHSLYWPIGEGTASKAGPRERARRRRLLAAYREVQPMPAPAINWADASVDRFADVLWAECEVTP